MARVLKDMNGDIGSHLRNHVHLTNCIHLRNQMHKKSPISTDTSFLRDLAALQRSRPLMDPSGSPSFKGDENGKKLKKNSTFTESANLKSYFHDMSEEAETSIHGYNRCLDRGKRLKFRSTKGTQTAKPPNDDVAQTNMPVASNIFAQNFAGQEYHFEGGENEYDEQNLTRGSRNGCAMVWSSIHHRGRSSRAESHLKTKTGGSFLQGEDFVDSSSSVKCDKETLPLLMEVSGSQPSTSTADWEKDYSGELGIYADNLLNYVTESDKVSEARVGHQNTFRRHHSHRHQSLTQKYIPRTFQDIVGQNLVVQALSNSVAKGKVGFVYVFYGPHGTGKTSSARVFARALNCSSMGQTKPCGFCNFCKAYDKGKTRNIKEIGPVSKFDIERIMNLLDNTRGSLFPSLYKVFIFDDCDTMSTNCWSALSKVVARAPRRVVFILVCSSLDVLPRVMISRCQKFFFPNLKDTDIIHSLRSIATIEVLDIDDNALKVIASRSDGSLRDAEMTLEQLSLLGQRITVSMVQELVGLTSDEKLLDLLDLALSADTVHTVKKLREIMESGVEPLALMSQLARVITDILAGACDLTKETSRRKFFQRQALSKEQMEKLRQALKMLSEAETQLRLSNDRSTWLIAALLQLASDQQYVLPNSSAATNVYRGSILHDENCSSEETRKSARIQGNYTSDRRHETSSMNLEQSISRPSDINKISDRQLSDIVYKDIEQIWSEVLEKIRVRRVKEFLYKEGRLISFSFDKAPTVELMFSSQGTKAKAESYGAHLLQAFESVLGSPLTIEIRCELKDSDSRKNDEIAYPEEGKSIKDKDKNTKNKAKDPEITLAGGDESSCKKSTITSVPEGSNIGEQSQKMSIVKSKVTLAQVIQAQQNRNSNRKTGSMAEELEWDNLRLEPSTRSLLCCKAPRRRQWKHSRSRFRNRKPKSLMRFVSCGKCISSKSPR